MQGETTAFMMTFVTPFYAGIISLIFIYLSWRIVELRNKYQIKMGDGGHTELTAATRAQSNLLEYLPVALILMLMLEFLGSSAGIIHVLGIWFIAARLLHLKGIKEPSGASRLRKIATRLTWAQMAFASLLCIVGVFGVIL